MGFFLLCVCVCACVCVCVCVYVSDLCVSYLVLFLLYRENEKT